MMLSAHTPSWPSNAGTKQETNIEIVKEKKRSHIPSHCSHCELVMRGTTDCHRNQRLTCSENEKENCQE